MAILTVRHLTVYRYSEPVELGEHRMMFRPRESHDLRLLHTNLMIDPVPIDLRWLHDVFDNSVAVSKFEGETTRLSFESVITLEHFESVIPTYELEDYARSYPFRYSDDDFPSLSPGLRRRSSSQEVSDWALQFLARADQTDTMTLLAAMTSAVRKQFEYKTRTEKGVQPPEETLRRKRGTCRDFAVLMIEAVRSLGLAARFVSGYIFSPIEPDPDSATRGGGATHAWMQVYLPGAGWIDFDPTNNIVGNRNLIRVAFAWTPDQVLPLWGTYAGNPGAFQGMDVAVSVTRGDIDLSELDAVACEAVGSKEA
ncbi:MAG: transglutaminase family protein [Acidobacteriota bacterium]